MEVTSFMPRHNLEGHEGKFRERFDDCPYHNADEAEFEHGLSERAVSQLWPVQGQCQLKAPIAQFSYSVSIQGSGRCFCSVPA